MARNLVTGRGKQVQIEGIPELQEKLNEILDRAKSEECKKIWMQGALELRDAAREYAPIASGPLTYYKKGEPPHVVQPGALRAAIFAAYGNPEDPNVLVGVNKQIAPHAHFAEYGTPKWAGQPYMRPAITLMRSRIVSVIADGYRKLLIDNGGVDEPNAPDGPIDPPTVTDKSIRRAVEKAKRTWAQRKTKS